MKSLLAALALLGLSIPAHALDITKGAWIDRDDEMLAHFDTPVGAYPALEGVAFDLVITVPETDAIVDACDAINPKNGTSTTLYKCLNKDIRVVNVFDDYITIDGVRMINYFYESLAVPEFMRFKKWVGARNGVEFWFDSALFDFRRPGDRGKTRCTIHGKLGAPATMILCEDNSLFDIHASNQSVYANGERLIPVADD
ncbi:hypothetical protein [Pseudohoeflea coraliihabitans]|uniref:Uncharacterized protein n=1 Tax=Pseudohoeflea coraliihabitans TaxID=2860393 RepID=A0ABS6WTB6_9HYPH|nr:hypothetical protein [Pseudohoeflea sp. DP4N28-3]MBW3099197.1 hypothetical protein [Pseudohoeflea sp. DP4N28-3]